MHQVQKLPLSLGFNERRSSVFFLSFLLSHFLPFSACFPFFFSFFFSYSRGGALVSRVWSTVGPRRNQHV